VVEDCCFDLHPVEVVRQLSCLHYDEGERGYWAAGIALA
jgi:hypothetical protein